jgi:hypothetical protein
MKRAALLILTLLVWCSALAAKTIDLDAATIADIDATFKAGASPAQPVTIARDHHLTRS